MKCSRCPFYKGAWMWNACELLGYECFSGPAECCFVNDDGTPNEDALEKAFGPSTAAEEKAESPLEDESEEW